MDLHVLASHDYPLDDGFDDLPLPTEVEVSPPAVQALGFGEHFAAGESSDGEEVDLAGKSGNLSVQLIPPRGERMVALSEFLAGDVPVEIETVELVRFEDELLVFLPEGLQDRKSVV